MAQIFNNRKRLLTLILTCGLVGVGCSHTQNTASREIASVGANDGQNIDENETAVDDESIEPGEHFPADQYANAGNFKRWLILTQLRGFYDNANGSVIPSIAMVEGARKTIDIEIYEMGDKDFRTSLRRALARKVRVRLIKDPTPVPTANECLYFDPIDPAKDNLDCIDQKNLLSEIRAAGGAVVPFVKSELCDKDDVPADVRQKKHAKRNPYDCYEHGKIILSDSRRALISSGNFNSSNFCNLKQNPEKCNRDFSFISKDKEIIGRLTQIFESDLKQTRYEFKPLMTGEINNKITISPYSLEPTIHFIESAKKSILIENQYLKQKDMNAALFAAAKRGVKVRVVQASLCSFGKPTDKEVVTYQKLFADFDSAGIENKMFTSKVIVGGKPGYLHAKAIVVDDEQAWVGSVNGSNNALENNREFGVFFHRPKWVKKLKEIIEKDLADPAMETWQESLTCTKDKEGLAPPTSSD